MTEKLLEALRFIIILFMLLITLYFGVSGYLSVDLRNLKEKAEAAKVEPITVDDTTYDNKFFFLYSYDNENIEELFPYLKRVTESFALLITAVAFGALGGVTRILKQAAFEGLKLSQIKIFYLPLLGMLSGIFVLGITYVIPTILVAGDQKTRPETLIFLALFAGLFSKRFYTWLSNSFDNIFKHKES